MRYHAPATFEEAVSIAAGASGVTRFLAGGPMCWSSSARALSPPTI